MHVCVGSVVQYVTCETTMKDGVDTSVQPDKSLMEMEKELLAKFQVRIFIEDVLESRCPIYKISYHYLTIMPKLRST